MKYNQPVLYSFRRCPYAIRTRMTLHYCQIKTEHREVSLANKPDHLLTISPKGTVPVLIQTDGTVLEESLDIMQWALTIADPDDWRLKHQQNKQLQSKELIRMNDQVFKIHLDHYKYADRFPDKNIVNYQQQCEVFLNEYDAILSQHEFLSGAQLSVTDIALFPFVRQCAFVDKNWFDQLEYGHLQKWLANLLNSDLFLSIMEKHSLFCEEIKN